MSKFDYLQFHDHNYNPTCFVLNYKKYKNNLDDLKKIITEECNYKRYTITEGYARYFPRHNMFDEGGGYVLVDDDLKGSFKVFIVEEFTKER